MGLVANDKLEELGEMIFGGLADLQDEQGDRSHEMTLPKIAASHFAAHFVTAGWANRCGLHAVSLGTARQAFEALSIIELGFLGVRGRNQLVRWEAGSITAGAVRQWLEAEEWPAYPAGIRGLSWIDFMSSLAKALQPYAHFSPRLLQWNMNVIQAPKGDHRGLVAVGPTSYDASRAARIQLLRGVLLWVLGMVMEVTQTGAPSDRRQEELKNLRTEIEGSEWLISDNWTEILTPHVWDAEGGREA